MAIIGYGRVSTTDQNLELQEAALKAADATIIRTEKRTGTTTNGREELKIILDFIGKGDTLLVTRIDRLARSVGDLQDIVRTLKTKGASLKATEEPIDTSTAAGKAFLDMLGVFAEFETSIRKERQLEGIDRAKKAGVYKGRKATIPVDKIRTMKSDGVGPAEIARELGISRQSVYRALAA
jgi:DNA invertase Pin-like site-specific DNA recombinase